MSFKSQHSDEEPWYLYHGKYIYLEFLKQDRDVFAWTYSETQGLDPTVAMHCLANESDWRSLKHVPRRLHPDIVAKVEAKVDKLITTSYVR